MKVIFKEFERKIEEATAASIIDDMKNERGLFAVYISEDLTDDEFEDLQGRLWDKVAAANLDAAFSRVCKDPYAKRRYGRNSKAQLLDYEHIETLLTRIDNETSIELRTAILKDNAVAERCKGEFNKVLSKVLKSIQADRAAHSAITEPLPDFISLESVTAAGKKRYSVNPALYLEHFKATQSYFIGGNGSQVYLYKDGCYQAVKPQEVKYIFDKDVERYAKEAKTIRSCNEFYEMLLHTDKIIDISEDIDTDYINFKNGLLNFETFKLEPHKPEVITVNQIPCNWETSPDILSTPVFDKYLNDLFGDDDETKEFIQTFMGLIISNVPSRHFKKCLLMVGKPDTGKSQIRALTEKIIGERNAASMDLKQLEDRFGTAGMYNKRLCGCTDMKRLDIDELPVFKQATGGDLINVEHKGQDVFATRFCGYFWFTCNELPRIRRNDQATYNRLVIVECNNVIPPDRRDTTLLDKMVRELPGIVYKCVAMAQMVVKNGYRLPIPHKSEQLVRQYIIDNNPVSEFLRNYAVPLNQDQKPSDGIEVQRFARVFDEWNSKGPRITPIQRNRAIADFYNIPFDNVIYRSNGCRYYPFTLNEDGKELKFYGCDKVN